MIPMGQEAKASELRLPQVGQKASGAQCGEVVWLLSFSN